MTNSPPIVFALNQEQAAFIQGGVSIVAASCGENFTTNLCKGYGCRVAADGKAITLFISAAQSGALLADVRANQKLALVFSQPSTSKSLQIKTRDAHVVALARDDYTSLAAYTQTMTEEITPLGFSEHLVRAVFTCSTSNIVAVRFTPNAVFDQTPGPNAGAQLQGAA